VAIDQLSLDGYILDTDFYYCCESSTDPRHRVDPRAWPAVTFALIAAYLYGHFGVAFAFKTIEVPDSTFTIGLCFWPQASLITVRRTGGVLDPDAEHRMASGPPTLLIRRFRGSGWRRWFLGNTIILSAVATIVDKCKAPSDSPIVFGSRHLGPGDRRTRC
jgi:hypothetical protein